VRASCIEIHESYSSLLCLSPRLSPSQQPSGVPLPPPRSCDPLPLPTHDQLFPPREVESLPSPHFSEDGGDPPFGFRRTMSTLSFRLFQIPFVLLLKEEKKGSDENAFAFSLALNFEVLLLIEAETSFFFLPLPSLYSQIPGIPPFTETMSQIPSSKTQIQLPPPPFVTCPPEKCETLISP